MYKTVESELKKQSVIRLPKSIVQTRLRLEKCHQCASFIIDFFMEYCFGSQMLYGFLDDSELSYQFVNLKD